MLNLQQSCYKYYYYKLIYPKNNGQNFLLNKCVIKQILRLSYMTKVSNIIEIGIGFGILSLFILNNNPYKIFSIELDISLYKYLAYIKNNDRFLILFEDAIKIKEDFFFKYKTNIIANLPYNISTNLILKWLKKIYLFKQILVLVQKEVAEIITATSNNKNYGRLTIISQLICKCKILFNISGHNFWPIVNINSSLIKMVPYKNNFSYKEIKKIETLYQKLFIQKS